jgi:hypothetical protein
MKKKMTLSTLQGGYCLKKSTRRNILSPGRRT